MVRPTRLLLILGAVGIGLLLTALAIEPTITVQGKLATIGGILLFVAGAAITYPGWKSSP